MILFEEFEIDTRPTWYISFQLGFGNQIYEIFVSVEIFREKHDLIELIIFVPILASFLRESELDTYYWFYSLFLASLIKLESPVHIPRIGDSDSSLSELFGTFRETSRITESSLKGIVCMGM